MPLDRTLFPPVETIGGMGPFDHPHLRPPYTGGPQVPVINPGGALQSPPPVSPLPAGVQRAAEVAQVFDPQHFAEIIDGNFVVPQIGVGAAVRVLERPPVRRNLLAIRNTSVGANVLIGFGIQASASSTFILAPGQTLMFDAVVPQNDVYLIADAAAATASVAYSNIG
jgi:hypothetical protein